jgi:hypothetical protein
MFQVYWDVTDEADFIALLNHNLTLFKFNIKEGELRALKHILSDHIPSSRH